MTEKQIEHHDLIGQLIDVDDIVAFSRVYHKVYGGVTGAMHIGRVVGLTTKSVRIKYKSKKTNLVHPSYVIVLNENVLKNIMVHKIKGGDSTSHL